MIYGCFLPKIRIYPPPSPGSSILSVILIYLLTTRRVHGYPLSYPVGYPGNELPDNGSPTGGIVLDITALSVWLINQTVQTVVIMA